MMGLASASRSALGKRLEKQNAPQFGVRGSAVVCKASLHSGATQLPLRPVVQAEKRRFGTLPMPTTAESPLLFAFCCFPRFPGFRAQGGEAKNSPAGSF